MKRLKFGLNPIVVKEFRSRMRGWRAFGILTFYLCFLGLFGYGIYRLTVISYTYGGTTLSPVIGQALFAALSNLSLFFVAFLTPALTSAAISSEHERLTLQMLQATPLAAHTILFGKLISATSYILLLLFASVPMFSLVFIFGGVTLTDLLLAELVILSAAVTFGMIGLFFSAWRKHTIQAIVLSYGLIILMVGGTYALYIFWGILAQSFPPRLVLMINPFSALASVLANSSSPAGMGGFFGVLSGWDPSVGDPTQLFTLRPLWHYTLTIYLFLSTGLYLLATRFIKPVGAWRLRRREIALVVGLLLLYLVLGVGIFSPDIQAAVFNSPLSTPTPVALP